MVKAFNSNGKHIVNSKPPPTPVSASPSPLPLRKPLVLVSRVFFRDNLHTLRC